MNDVSFQVEFSVDGPTWNRDPVADSDVYWHVARNCRDRSRLLGRYERIWRPDLEKEVVTFFDGMPVSAPDASF